MGKPLKSIIHGRADIPIYLAAIGPKNVELCAEIADGWLPIFFSPAHYDESYREQVEAGFAKAGNGKSYADFDIAPSVGVVVSDDVDAARNSIKPSLALYIGGMGAKSKNFYYNLVCRYGFEDAADEIQEHFLAGRKAEATAGRARRTGRSRLPLRAQGAHQRAAVGLGAGAGHHAQSDDLRRGKRARHGRAGAGRDASKRVTPVAVRGTAARDGGKRAQPLGQPPSLRT